MATQTAEFRAGDWNCNSGSCGHHNFARQTSCRMCGQPKPSERLLQMPNYRPGDWLCTNCQEHNFSRNTVCRQCDYAKDGRMGAGPSLMANLPPPAFHPGDWMAQMPPQMPAIPPQLSQQMPPMPPQMNPQMSPVSYGFGTPYGGGGYGAYPMQYQPSYPVSPAYGMGTASRPTNSQEWRSGDWACPKAACGFHNFAKQSTCRKCGGEKP